MIKTKYMFSEAKAKDLAAKATAKDMTSPRGQGHGLEDSISVVRRLFCVLRVLAVFGLNATLIFSLIIIIIIIINRIYYCL